MQFKLFKPLWGFSGSPGQAAYDAVEAGFDGIEGPAPNDLMARSDLAASLEEHRLDYIAEICTGGSYVPDRKATPAEHLTDLERKVINALPLRPRLCNVMAGCDAWPLEVQYDFFAAALEIGARHSVTLSFETHRSRSMFNPWVTEALIRRLPELRLTADISHWVVVAERLLEDDWELLLVVADHVHHLHGRVGYPQGPQVPHPAAPEYADCLAFHQRFWEAVWCSQRRRDYVVSSMTPEFGPDGYLHTLPFTDQPVADLWQINRWVGDTERAHFQCWSDFPLNASSIEI
ncbi:MULTISPECIES: sugar phosphate isomerase/epimerase [unclassified Pseudomonas]|uniref:sugar phosphate isomerase/epimerase family protein n=1 Tax=unclassified Pseudomonas TaxID=196821 RepID=UPI000C88C148|nr:MULTISPECIES: TIM barrel protein [unclassified Pseudomonas]PMX20923.1 xylose isomerase [Pseudomonas sp. GW460-12]PMX31437.1 xylose isomerase [Pseudomonas sp. MPR-R2A4]PMX38638.1 xylose isomerase [Pseudomonas sp. MPR-R2A7]PMX52192.1 xylose isomerase [Pseudomonas sp. MPR-R2A6]PMX86648.1 xylose isomerase [Pseudomonas sp. MPR-R2A3]